MGLLLATFDLADFRCAVVAADVQEVLMAQPRTPVPGTASCVAGLINLRGQVVPTLDLRTRMGLGDRPDGEPGMSVVVRWHDEVWSLLVDRIGDVIEVDENDFEPPPLTLDGSLRQLIVGAYKLPDRLLLMLDVAQLLTVGGEPALR